MDDNSFDRVVKEKLDGYEDPSFDESSLVDFQEKIGGVYSTPWYQRSFKYLVATLIAVTTSAIIFLYLSGETENRNLALINRNQQMIDSLQEVIKTRTIETTASGRQSQNVHEPAAESDNVKQNSPASTGRNSSNIVALGPVDQLPEEVREALIRNGMLMNDNGSAYLVTPMHEDVAHNTWHKPSRIREVYHSPTFSIAALPVNEKSVIALTSVEEENEFPLKTEDVSEKHYTKGLGINIGPHADMIFPKFSKGKGLPTPRVGFLAELVISPRFSFEGGIDYSTSAIDFDRDFQTIEIPNLDTNLGTINSAHIKNSLLSTPLSFKYRKDLSEKSQGFIRIGYTPYFSILQEYQCGYKASYYYNPSQQPYGNRNVTSILQAEDNFYYGSTSTMSLGFTRTMKKNDKIEGSLFYETSLSAVGKEKLAMSLFGIRTAYWFNIR